MKRRIKVLIIDDSELIRAVLTEILNFDEGIEVIGTAYDPIDAREKIKLLNPDVLTLDIEMPRMDGLTFLANLMRLRPTPVVMISTLTEKGADSTLRAMELGAIDYIEKPKMAVRKKLPELAANIVKKVKVAACANVLAIEQPGKSVRTCHSVVSPYDPKAFKTKIKAIAIGASTGGTEAIKSILIALPKKMPPIVIVQHMPESFTHSFAKRLDGLVDLTVTAFNGDANELKEGYVYIASGRHLMVEQRSNKLFCYSDDGQPVNRHKPSVDTLFDSIAKFSSDDVLAVILTGMGSDGASGMKNIKDNGAITIAQNESSSVVWGMPKAAVDQNSVTEVLPLNEIGGRLASLCYGNS